jgi:DNA-binding GntR family transcriptional regulator
MTDPSPTRVASVHALLRRDILSGRLAPGSRLAAAILQERYGASSGLLREVLPRLVAEGLAVAKPQRGYWVISVSPEDLRHLTEARVLIETTVLRQSIQDGDIAWESRALAAHHTLANTAVVAADRSGVNEAWVDAHAQFHAELLAGAANLRLRGIADSLRDITEVYRIWSGRFSEPGERSADTVAAEHKSLLEATLARDANLAAAELTLHIERTTKQLLANLASMPGGQSRSA